ncbi:hypothetical protein IEO21_03536 [Rhodonia placenta]|uniref:VPS37 C-terminal domain-containing protein n=2 Tax=Rhodonia placenta TaxID=104341 RepID=A0A1X6MUE0_9APHY|nr:hypothetical protein POSPLADRAFT_1075391 [Postia placenta MAD-698-R-SB12]KAF9817276.1 hypothetical protein IEO21_03536 [Postia placenta]OSX59939.1 hypothetical protein POSPLADRAFT_1075391 [Postia placenta MAD-698-R-SB12]
MSTQLLADFPELSHLSRDDLQELLVDPVYFQALFHSLNQVKALYQAQAELGNANDTIAKNNLTLQDSLYQLRSETQEAFNEAKDLEAKWKEVEKEQREVYQRFTPQFLLMRLRHATTAQDDLSEARATEFVQASSVEPNVASANSKDIDDFVREFKELRKVYHKRVMWGDRWAAGQVTWRDE